MHDSIRVPSHPRRGGGRRAARTKALIASAIAVSVVLAACGGDDDDATPTTEAATATTTEETTEATETTAVANTTEVTLAPTTSAVATTVPPTTAPAAEVDLSQVDPDGVLRVGSALTFPSGIHNDPTKSAVNADETWMRLVYGTLLRRTQTGGIEPWMAESYEIVDDQTMTIVLRDGITFPDGSLYDAEAVKAGLLRTLNEASEPTIAGQNLAFRSLADVTVVDPLTLTISLNAPSIGEFALTLTSREGAIVSPAQVASAPEEIDLNPVGAGPFMVTEFKDAQIVALTKNPDFIDSDQWLLGGIEFINVADGASMVNGLQTAALDMVLTGLPVVDASRIEGDPAFEIRNVANDTSYTSLNLCYTKPPLDTIDVRRAMQHAIDRDDLNDLVYEGLGQPHFALWPPDHAYFNPDIQPLIDYDPEKAIELLGGQTVDMDLAFMTILPGHDVIAEVLQAHLQAVGFNVTLVPVQDPLSEFIVPQKPGALLIIGSRTGADKYNRVFGEGQAQTMCDGARQDIIDLVAPAAVLVPGDERAADIFQTADMIVAEDALIIPLLVTPALTAWNLDKLGGEQIYTGAGGVRWDTFYVKK